ncbi:hypothetical protein BpHYR1_049302 [Brachionus plicatilis]|uniref:Uncharacterized protein n=1 Tax=Brachionus plicatilis TaxID=10195 RepID=A0A3M7SDP5_BRAPC|nr:hypothetical protein BpHYR1_049302 [Brachionus plicatilis]
MALMRSNLAIVFSLTGTSEMITNDVVTFSCSLGSKPLSKNCGTSEQHERNASVQPAVRMKKVNCGRDALVLLSIRQNNFHRLPEAAEPHCPVRMLQRVRRHYHIAARLFSSHKILLQQLKAFVGRLEQILHNQYVKQTEKTKGHKRIDQCVYVDPVALIELVPKRVYTNGLVLLCFVFIVGQHFSSGLDDRMGEQKVTVDEAAETG